MRIGSLVIALLLLLTFLGSLLASVQIFKHASQSGSAIREIEALICALIATVALAGVGVINALESPGRQVR